MEDLMAIVLKVMKIAASGIRTQVNGVKVRYPWPD